MVDPGDRALRHALRNELPRLAARQKEIAAALQQAAQEGDTEGDFYKAAFRLAARYPEIGGLLPLIAAAGPRAETEVRHLGISPPVLQAGARLACTLLEAPRLLGALERVFPLPVSEVEATSTQAAAQGQEGLARHLQEILMGRWAQQAREAQEEGRHPEARRLYAELAERAEATGERKLAAWALHRMTNESLASDHFLPGNPPIPAELLQQVRSHLEHALMLVEGAGDETAGIDAGELRQSILAQLSGLALYEKRFADALKIASSLMASSIERQDEPKLMTALLVLGNAYLGLEQHAKALPFLLQARKLARKLGSEGEEAAILFSLGTAWSGQGHGRLASAAIMVALLLDRQLSRLVQQGDPTVLADLASLGEAVSKLEEEGRSDKFLTTVNRLLDGMTSKLDSLTGMDAAP